MVKKWFFIFPKICSKIVILTTFDHLGARNVIRKHFWSFSDHMSQCLKIDWKFSGPPNTNWDIEFYKINIVTSVTPKNFSTHFPDMSWVCRSLQMIISFRRSKRGDHMRRRKNFMVANVRYWRFLKIDTNFSKIFSDETSKSSVLPSRQGGFNRL